MPNPEGASHSTDPVAACPVTRPIPFVHPIYYPNDAGESWTRDSNGDSVNDLERWTLLAEPTVRTSGSPFIKLTPASPVKVGTDIQLCVTCRNSGCTDAYVGFATIQLCAVGTELPWDLITVADSIPMRRESGDVISWPAEGQDLLVEDPVAGCSGLFTWYYRFHAKESYEGHRCLLVTTWGFPGTDGPMPYPENGRPHPVKDRHVGQRNMTFLPLDRTEPGSDEGFRTDASTRGLLPGETRTATFPEVPSGRGAFAFWIGNRSAEDNRYRIGMRLIGPASAQGELLDEDWNEKNAAESWLASARLLAVAPSGEGEVSSFSMETAALSMQGGEFRAVGLQYRLGDFERPFLVEIEQVRLGPENEVIGELQILFG